MYKMKALAILNFQSFSPASQRIYQSLGVKIAPLIRRLATPAQRWDFPPDHNGGHADASSHYPKDGSSGGGESRFRPEVGVHVNSSGLGGDFRSLAGQNPSVWSPAEVQHSQRFEGFAHSGGPGPVVDFQRSPGEQGRSSGELFESNSDQSGQLPWKPISNVGNHTAQFQRNSVEFQPRVNEFSTESFSVLNSSVNTNSRGSFQLAADEFFREGSDLSAYGETSGNADADGWEGPTCKGTLEELDECCKEGKTKDAVEYLGLLERNGTFVDLDRCLLLFQACSDSKSLEEARVVHDYVSRRMGDVGVGVNNKILGVYSKCGSMADAFRLFDRMPCRNLTSWDNMIKGLADNGLGEEAIDLFTEFKQKGLKPDWQIFIAVFSACGTIGAVDEGFLHLESMEKVFGIAPRMEHYVGIVDMLGRSGYLDEAFEFIEKMPVEAGVDVWEALMNLCRVNGNVELGDRFMEVVEHLDSFRVTENTKKGLLPVNAAELAKEIERKKSNSLAARSKVHEYRAGDRSHPETARIYALLRGLAQQMKEVGYFPELRIVLHDVDQESKSEALLSHSERLAVAYGCMTSPARSEIRVIKNLRTCVDCHNALKIISKIIGRKLTMRDAKRFHHFENGVCSCKDYW